MPQTREDRMYRYFRSLKRSGEFQHSHYRKGWYHSPYMTVAIVFKVPVKTVREVIEARRGDG